MFTAVFFHLTAAVMAAVALWRAPAALRYGDTQRRALCASYVGYGAAIWLQTPTVVHVMEQVPVTELSILLEQCCGTAAIAAIISYVAASYSQSAREAEPRYVLVSGFIARISPRVAVGVVALLTLTFFTVVDRRDGTSGNFAAEHGGEWGAALFLTIFYAYLAASCTVTGYQWASVARRTDTWPLRIGLVLMALSMTLGWCFVILRTFFIWGTVADPSLRSLTPAMTQVTGALWSWALIFFAAGSSVPAANAVISRWSRFRLLRALEPLRRDLMAACSEVSFESALSGRSADRPTSLLRDLTDWSLPLTIRLSSRVHEIADAVEQLRGYAPPGLFHAAEDLLEDSAEDLPNPQATAEALYIRAALCAAARNRRTREVSEPLPRKALSRSEDEARWWRQVHREYAAISPAQAEALLADVASESAAPHGSPS
ncbi:MAB_1171c family putative transporter [Streptomyces sp. YGL11-2]|uniref:MAB_1171c family putative transporter n=1 Tax=Streptomyces sp. YGL11-2 TaxID=3414028 RepID=UPI003CF3BA30